MSLTNCGCDSNNNPITPCPSNSGTCLETTGACCVYYNTGDTLSNIGVTAAQNRKLCDILKLMDTALGTLTGSDFSAYNYLCVTDTGGGAITTQQEWVEGMSKAFCDYKTSNNAAITTINNNITTINTDFTTNVNNAVITSAVTCTELTSINHTVDSTLSTDLDRLRTGICTTYNLLVARTDISSVTWGSCLSTTTSLPVAIQNIATKLCTLEAQIGALSTSSNPCGKLSEYTFTGAIQSVFQSTTSCKNQYVVALDTSKVIKTSFDDTCDGYLFDKLHAGNDIDLSLQTITAQNCSYINSNYITNTATFDSVTINGTLYTPASSYVVTNATDIQTYLNSLGLGSYIVIYIAGQLIIAVNVTTGDLPQYITVTDGSPSNYNFVIQGTCTTTTCEKVVISAKPLTWIPLTLTNGWADSGLMSAPAYAVKDDGTVMFRGTITKAVGTIAANTLVTSEFCAPTASMPGTLESFVTSAIDVTSGEFVSGWLAYNPNPGKYNINYNNHTGGALALGVLEVNLGTTMYL